MDTDNVDYLKRFQSDLLEQHNLRRKEHGVPDLIWSEEMAEQSQAWAEKMANEESLHHSTPDERSRNGENIACNANKIYTGIEATEQWYSEIRDFDYEDCSEFHPKTGHFTQVIWKSSLYFGAGIATNNGKHYVCARYSPPGNMRGEFEENLQVMEEVPDDENEGQMKMVVKQRKNQKPQNENLMNGHAVVYRHPSIDYDKVDEQILIVDDKEIPVQYNYEEIKTPDDLGPIYETVEVTSLAPKMSKPMYACNDQYLKVGKSYQVTHYIYST